MTSGADTVNYAGNSSGVDKIHFEGKLMMTQNTIKVSKRSGADTVHFKKVTRRNPS